MATKLVDLEDQRRDAILNAALKEFAIRGFDDASTNIIAKEAGISKALMFHYVTSKKELFLFTYDYFNNLMIKEYYELMNFEEKDIFERLHQSYLLQIELLKRYPWIFELNKLSITYIDVVNKEAEDRTQKEQASCYLQLFDRIDESKFREGLDIERSKQIIFWSNSGFTNQILDDIRNSKASEVDYSSITAKLDGYLEELKKMLYKK
jgi:AcrR family transcriptional regulator